MGRIKGRMEQRMHGPVEQLRSLLSLLLLSGCVAACASVFLSPFLALSSSTPTPSPSCLLAHVPSLTSPLSSQHS